MKGLLSVVGVGPGSPQWCTPAVTDRLREATDLVGYAPYLDLVPEPGSATRHPSDNRAEADRAVHALDLAAEGARVVVVSSGDPGVFAMAAAVMEQLDLHPDRWRDVAVEVLPGITAAQGLASRVGAPLGHDFCTISLSDVLKPWDVIARRLDAVAAVDLVIALYNPRSRHRPHQFADALGIIARHRCPTTPVVLGRDIARRGETITVTELARVDPEQVDMRTVVIVGSSTTRVLDRAGGPAVYTSRRYPSSPSVS